MQSEAAYTLNSYYVPEFVQFYYVSRAPQIYSIHTSYKYYSSGDTDLVQLAMADVHPSVTVLNSVCW